MSLYMKKFYKFFRVTHNLFPYEKIAVSNTRIYPRRFFLSSILKATVLANITAPRWAEVACAHFLGISELATKKCKGWHLT